MELKKPLNEKLKELRIQKGPSQNDVAKQLFISRQAVSSWEIGHTEPGKEQLFKLCLLYDTSIDELYETNKTSRNESESKKY